MSEFIATILGIEVDVTVPYAKGKPGTYVGTVITYQVGDNIQTKALAAGAFARAPNLKRRIQELSEGELPTRVKFVQEENGQYTNLLDLADLSSVSEGDVVSHSSPVSSSKSSNSGHSSGRGKDDAIAKAVALKAAVEYSAGKDASPELIVSLAKEFEAYLKGA